MRMGVKEKKVFDDGVEEQQEDELQDTIAE